MKLTVVKLLCTVVVCTHLLISCKKEGSIEKPAENQPVEQPSENVTKPDLDIVETLPAVQVAVTANITTNCGGYYRALPAYYDSSSKQYPLMIFIHGQSSLGNGSSTALTKIAGGPYAMLKNKKFPASFISNGKKFSFIVISPQFKTWPSADDVEAVVQYFSSSLRVDKSRIYVTGLSMGGGATWDYAGKYASKIAAIAPVAGASGIGDAQAKTIANNKLPVWAFHNKDDDKVTVNNTINNVSKINSYNPAPKAKMTLWNTGGHDAWTNAYKLTNKENNMNVFEWLLQYHR